MINKFILWLVHLFLALYRFIRAFTPRRPPSTLKSRRAKLPNHLAVILTDIHSNGTQQSALPDALETVRRLSLWCGEVGIRKLSIFDEKGLLLENWKRVQAVLESSQHVEASISYETKLSTNAELSDDEMSKKSSRQLSTPPLSHSTSATSLDSSAGSESLSTGSHLGSHPCLVTFKPAIHSESGPLRHRTRRLPEMTGNTIPAEIYLLSKSLGKAHIANVAANLAHSAVLAEKKTSLKTNNSNYSLTVQQLAAILEDPATANGWPCPDLVIVHTPETSGKYQYAPLEFHGLPPWHIHHAETTYIPPRRPVSNILRSLWPLQREFPAAMSELSFREALDEYDSAEMRFGK